MSMFEAVGACFQKYAVFRGRARRREYWFFNLFNIIIASICSFIANAANSQFMYLLLYIYELAVLIPSLAVSWRRMHDIGKSGTYALLPYLIAINCVLLGTLASLPYLIYLLIPVGFILDLVWKCRDGQPNTNAYGEDPKGREWRRPQERDESGCVGGTQGAAAGGISPSSSAYTQPYTGASNSQNKKVWLSDNAEFRAKLAQAGDAEEVAGLFAEEGVKVTAAEAKAVRAYANANKSTAKTTRMNFFEAVGACFQKYAVFTGRAGKDEYGEFIWFCYIVSNFGNDLLESSVGSSEFVSILLTLFDALTLIPRLAVISRRLHDLGVSGAYMLTIYVPIVLGEVLYGLTSNVNYLLLLFLGIIPLLILSFKDGEPFTNAYGPDPKGRETPNPALLYKIVREGKGEK